MINLDELKADREGRENEAWVKARTGIETSDGEQVCTAPLGFKRRILRLPELEAGYIAQCERIDELENCLTQHGLEVSDVSVVDLTPRRPLPQDDRYLRHTRVSVTAEWVGERLPDFAKIVKKHVESRRS